VRNPKGQYRMENPEKPKGAVKNGKSRETQRGSTEWKIQRNRQHMI
jgi:hypothetical protein